MALLIVFQLFFVIFSCGDSIEAGTEIQSITNDFSLTEKQEAEIDAAFAFVQIWKDEGAVNYFKLKEFATDNLTSLEQIADEKSLMNGLRANSLLFAATEDVTYEPDVIFPTNGTTFNYQQIGDNTEVPVRTEGINLTVSPNPTNGQTEISYDIPRNISCTVLQLVDFSGKTLIEQKVDARQGTVVFDSSNYPRGILVCQLFCDDELIFSKKIISIK